MGYSEQHEKKPLTPGVFRSAASALDTLKDAPVENGRVTLTIRDTTEARGRAIAVLIALSHNLMTQDPLASLVNDMSYDAQHHTYTAKFPVKPGTKGYPVEQIKTKLKLIQQQIMVPLVMNLEEVLLGNPPAKFFALPCADENNAEFTLGALLLLGKAYHYNESNFGFGKKELSDGKVHPCAFIKAEVKNAIIKGESVPSQEKTGP